MLVQKNYFFPYHPLPISCSNLLIIFFLIHAYSRFSSYNRIYSNECRPEVCHFQEYVRKGVDFDRNMYHALLESTYDRLDQTELEK